MEVIIKINGQAVAVEVSVEVYAYLDETEHKEENLNHEKRRHWDYREFDEYIIIGESSRQYYYTPEQWVCQKETLQEIEYVLSCCTAAQRERFLLYALDELSYSQIGELHGCSKYSVRDSISAVRKKYQEIFKNRPHETPFSG